MFIAMINIIIIKFYYLQIQEYEILKYIPYVYSSCVRKRIIVKWPSKDNNNNNNDNDNKEKKKIKTEKCRDLTSVFQCQISKM